MQPAQEAVSDDPSRALSVMAYPQTLFSLLEFTWFTDAVSCTVLPENKFWFLIHCAWPRVDNSFNKHLWISTEWIP